MSLSPIKPPSSPELRQAVSSIREHVILCVFYSAAYNVIFLAPSLYAMQVYDRVLNGRSFLTLALLTVILVISLATASFLDNLRTRVMDRAGLKFESGLRQAVFAALITAPPTDLGARRGFRDLETVRNFISGPAFMMIVDAPWALLYLSMCFVLHPVLGAGCVVGAAVLIALALLNERVMRPVTEEVTKNTSRVSSQSEWLAQSSDIIRALGMRDRLAMRLSHMRSGASLALLKAQLGGGSYQSGVRFFRTLFQSIMLGLGAYLVIKGKMSPGGIFASSMFVSRALQPIEMIAGSWTVLGMTLKSWRDLDALLASRQNEDRMRLPEVTGRMTVEGLALGPSPKQVLLQGVSFTVEPGEVLGIVGPSGSGKSTLARVLLGAQKPLAGTIRIDNAELDHWHQDQLARAIGWSPQNVSLMPGTLRDNISRFETDTGVDPEYIDALVVDAARAAGVHDLILGFPQGYMTPVGPGGIPLSGGQTQRVALARALYGAPKLLILDEPDSFLDRDGEESLQNVIQECRQRGAAVILIGHRISLMRMATRLMMIREGKLLPASIAPVPDAGAGRGVAARAPGQH